MLFHPIRAFAAGVLAIAAFSAFAQEQKQIHIVYMGGDDCPPCLDWRKNELPKLKLTEVFSSIKFSYIRKGIHSPVPSRIFLPDEVKPYKEKLDVASNGLVGSAQVAILVNGEVFDYYFGSERKAADVERMLLAIRNGTPYPFTRCLKARDFWKCEVQG